MTPRIRQEIKRVIAARGLRPLAALEVGGLMGPNSLLRLPGLDRAPRRACLNLSASKDHEGIEAVRGNANRMTMFADGEFDFIVTNAMLEHDKNFWLSIAEMHRVLAPGGTLIIGVPGFDDDPAKQRGQTTETFKFHMAEDYYRFSHLAVRSVFFDGLEDVEVRSIMRPPRIIGAGRKPKARKKSSLKMRK